MNLLQKWNNYHMNENTLLWILIGAMIISTIADMYTALSSPIFYIAETNPIYLLTGSTLPLIAMSIFVIYFFYTKLSKSISLYMIYFFTLLSVVLVALHGFGAWSNISAYEQYESNPELYVESVSEISTGTKLTYYVTFVGILFSLLLGMPLIAFWVTMKFFHQRKPKRDKIVDEIYHQAM